jgi:hypothetical protein
MSPSQVFEIRSLILSNNDKKTENKKKSSTLASNYRGEEDGLIVDDWELENVLKLYF